MLWSSAAQVARWYSRGRELIREHGPQSGKLLDAGSKAAQFLDIMPEYERYGIDISPTYAEETRAHGFESHCGPIEDMPYQDAIFDIVNVTDVLEHVYDFNVCMAEIFRVLKPGGIFLIRVPVESTLAPYVAPSYPYKFTHVRMFDESVLTIWFTRMFPGEIVHMERDQKELFAVVRKCIP
jgi:SAM-dependent methyltransferase